MSLSAKDLPFAKSIRCAMPRPGSCHGASAVGAGASAGAAAGASAAGVASAGAAGVAGAAAGAGTPLVERELKKPASHARCSGLNGASSGIVILATGFGGAGAAGFGAGAAAFAAGAAFFAFFSASALSLASTALASVGLILLLYSFDLRRSGRRSTRSSKRPYFDFS